jgi:hypothetical protein
MGTKSGIFSIILFVTALPSGFSQLIKAPNYSLKSHETLEISKVEISGSKTVVYLTIENRISNGSFCADKNIYLIDPDGKKLKLMKATGIPVCPDSYKFKVIGEKLQFSLEFPPIIAGTKWVDIVEDCSDNCFSFYGVTLDTDLNSRINEAFSKAGKGETGMAIALYKNILKSESGISNGVIGGIYNEIITLSVKIGDKAGADEWYKKLESSNVQRLQLYINNLNSRGIKF